MSTEDGFVNRVAVSSIWVFDCTELATMLELHQRVSSSLIVPITLYHLYREFYLINHQQYDKLSEPWAHSYIRHQQHLRKLLHPLGSSVVCYNLRYADAWVNTKAHINPFCDDLHIKVTRHSPSSRGL